MQSSFFGLEKLFLDLEFLSFFSPGKLTGNLPSPPLIVPFQASEEDPPPSRLLARPQVALFFHFRKKVPVFLQKNPPLRALPPLRYGEEAFSGGHIDPAGSSSPFVSLELKRIETGCLPFLSPPFRVGIWMREPPFPPSTW